MHEREYLRLKREIEDRCRKDLEALERVWHISKKDDSGGGIKRGDLQTAIIRAIAEFNHDFTAEQVLAKIRVSDPEIGERTKASSVSSALKRMVGNQIETRIRGVGRTPSLYLSKKADLKIVGS